MTSRLAKRFLKGLNPAQQAAVEQTEGPLLILAGAGSGKTKTLIHRIAYTLARELATPKQVLAVTFTNKASHEMRQRIYNLLKNSRLPTTPSQFMPFMGTFHSICHRLLRLEASAGSLDLAPNFIIYDQLDSRQLIKKICKQLQLNPTEYKPQALAAYISRQKNQLESFGQEADWQEAAERVQARYQQELVDQGAVDFDDLILLTVKLLKDKPKVRQKWQDCFKYVMVDEYQDTNNLQYQLIKLLTPDSNNIAVVGDDWQSIYNWRGADYKIILNFDRDYPKATIVKLEQNYRSSKNILDAAHAVISKNQLRSKKQLWTAAGYGPKIKIFSVGSAQAEALVIAQTIKTQMSDGDRPYQDFAVFYRTNAQSRNLEEQLIRHSIPYRIYGGTRFYDRKEVKDVLAYLRLIYQPDDRLSFERVVNLPPRGLGSKSLQVFSSWLEAGKLGLGQGLAQIDKVQGLTPKAQQSLADFARLVGDLSQKQPKLTPAALIEELVTAINYFDYLEDGTAQGAARIENVEELVTMAKQYDRIGLVGFLEEAALLSSNDQASGASAESVVLMTLHAAKGLEFPVVFMAGMEEEIIPHARAIYDHGQEAMAEERRLCYVGMTRARQDLHLLHASHRQTFGDSRSAAPSRFLKDIPEELVERIELDNYQQMTPQVKLKTSLLAHDFKQGDRIQHQTFGKGVVTATEGDNLVIDFTHKGIKRINLTFAPLEKL